MLFKCSLYFFEQCILVRSGCDEGGMCVFVSSRVFAPSRGFVDLWGCFPSRCLCRSMVAWSGSQSEAGVYRCL